MRYVFVLLFLLFNYTSAQADEVALTVGSYVHHTDRSKNLNEDNKLIGLRYGHDINESLSMGILLQDFENSINKQTTLLWGFIEKDIYDNSGFTGALGLY